MAQTLKSPYYPLRGYRNVDEIRVGDVVRMRHNDEVHGGISPAFDDSIIIEIDAKGFVTLSRVHLSLRGGKVEQHVTQFSVDAARLVTAFDVFTRGAGGEIDNRVDEQQYAVHLIGGVTLPAIALERGVFEDKTVLTAALRGTGVLPADGTVSECHYESGGYLVSTTVPGMTVKLEFIAPTKRVPAEYA